MPLVTIVLPVFNATATLVETLSSLRAQSLRDFEIVAVDDHSTDGSSELLRALAEEEPRLRVLTNPRKGPSAARNHGACQGRGRYIAFCDADDLWHPDKLARLVPAFTRSDASAFYGRVAFVTAEGAPTGVVSRLPAERLSIAALLGENPVCCMSNLTVRAEAFFATGGFDEDMVHAEDVEWMIRLIGAGGRVCGLPEVQVSYRASPAGLSSDLGAMARGRARALRTAARYGVRPDRRAEAVHHRYLARRALRLGLSPAVAIGHALRGLARAPGPFLVPPRRGVATLAAAVLNPILPRALARRLFAR